MKTRSEQALEDAKEIETVWVEGNEQDLIRERDVDKFNEHCASFHELELRESD